MNRLCFSRTDLKGLILIILSLLLVLTCGCGKSSGTVSEASAAPQGSSPSASESKADEPEYNKNDGDEPMRVVIIGDSNTEYGRITDALKEILSEEYGHCSNGFLCFSSLSAQPKPSGVNISIGDWISEDVTTEDNWYGTTQVDGPFGLNISSDTKDDTVTVKYHNDSFSLYYLMQPGGGELNISLDGKDITVLKTQADSKYTAKYTYNTEGEYDNSIQRLKISLVNGKGTLFGIDVFDKAKENVAVHNWGNAGANSQHFFHADKATFETALKELNPTHVVYLIGTNDGVDNDKFKEAVTEQMNRIASAVPDAVRMVVSTFDIDYEASKEIVQEYLASAWPEAAAETGSAYWNMHEFFGPYNPDQMQDGWHCNLTGGRKIAKELYAQLTAVTK